MGVLQAGDALGSSYKLIKKIGSGAVGEVWRVSHLRGGLDLAAKLLRPEHAQDSDLVEKFIKERSVLLSLQHENIVVARDLVVEGDQLAIVMDLVEGGTLRDALQSHGTLVPGSALGYTIQVLDALAVAHQNGVTHRDIKPDNVLLDHEMAKVSDFGIASVLQGAKKSTSGMLGTPAYMPPELFTRGEAGTSGDIYATGVLLYELLAGRTPFAGSGNDYTLSFRHVSTVPPRLDLPETLWDALSSMLAKDPSDRPDASTAAYQLRELAKKYADLPALVVTEEPTEFRELERPATVIRSSEKLQSTSEPETSQAQESPELPDLGIPSNHTVIRPMGTRKPAVPIEKEPETDQRSQVKRPDWLTTKAIWLLSTAAFLLVVLILGIILIPGAGGKGKANAEKLTATQQDQILPSGLGITRRAVYDSQTGDVELTVTYSAQKTPLRGEFFESLPASGDGSTCPNATWDGAKAVRNQQSINGVAGDCGWQLTDVAVPKQSTAEARAKLHLEMADQQALDEWLKSAAEATQKAMSDPATQGSAYPIQRLQDIAVKSPTRTVSQTPLPVKLIPVWPSGPDELNPIYASPATGKPTAVLQSVSQGEAGVRFADGCSGALAVSKDGLVVTALSVSPQCTVRATVGNYTDLQSNPFSITTR
ncbi:serine/threonine-protein kinase [Glutamicibacter sp. JC586]|uniref:serine/threonine-protein kinase n=1 Tax=Glutamicibacter sp. JC586 TaxID=2590552 RepID=UPI0013574DCF|nr:serine/threonine-protein kinase [Glutamicibacter sp. JC586]